MLRTTALMILTLAIALLALVIAMATLIAPAYVWLHLDREQLAGFGLILIYWCTLVLAHYYYETRVTRARVEAEISVARLRAAAFLDARDERRDVARSNGDVQAHGGSRGGSRRAGVAAGATATAVVTEPAAQVTGRWTARPMARARPMTRFCAFWQRPRGCSMPAAAAGGTRGGAS